MRIIDIHTHFFPDNIAKASIDFLEKEADIKAYSDGTVASMRKYMKEDGVDICVNQPVATKKEQVISINRKMIEFNKTSKDIIAFGAMHPDFYLAGNVAEEIEFIAKNGIKGIKLHAEYQDFFPDEERVQSIYEACRKNNLIILFHAGVDFAYDREVRATPERLKQVTKISGLKMIFAHFGSYLMYDGVIKHLCGTSAYFDTAYTADMDPKDAEAIVKAHGADKILFGTDFPWERASNVRKTLESAVTDKKALEKIFHENAEKLLNI
jgi:predicted TIM-barrel fold metal-dependent hydrolase